MFVHLPQTVHDLRCKDDDEPLQWFSETCSFLPKHSGDLFSMLFWLCIRVLCRLKFFIRSYPTPTQFKPAVPTGIL